MSKERDIAQQLINHLGGPGNVKELEVCMTRMRVDPVNLAAADQAALKKVSGVKGVIQTGSQIQIILGPGLAQNVTAEAEEIVKAGGAAPAPAAAQAETVAAPTRAGVSDFLRKIASVFVPLLPAIIGAGLIIALNNALQRLGVITPDTAIAGYSVIQLLAVLGNSVMGFLFIMVGMNAARTWGGPPAIGAVGGAILFSPALPNLDLVVGRGGLIGAFIAGAFLGWLYRNISRRMPDIINIIATPFLTILFGGLVVLFIIQPIGGWLSTAITTGSTALVETGGPIAGFVLAGLFLPLVMLGIHQGLTPIHQELINTLGVTTLLPILAMAGAGQVGASFAVRMKTKNPELKKIVDAGLVPGILGIGEPLIYGVTLPLFRPFIGACIGAAFGGATIAFFKVGAHAMGVSGVLLAALVDQVVPYLLGIVVAYIAGFIATWFIGFDDSGFSEGSGHTFDLG